MKKEDVGPEGVWKGRWGGRVPKLRKWSRDQRTCSGKLVARGWGGRGVKGGRDHIAEKHEKDGWRRRASERI